MLEGPGNLEVRNAEAYAGSAVDPIGADDPSERSEGSLDIFKWFTNHSQALGLLKDEQTTGERFQTTHRFLTLIFPVISRWTFHFLAVRRMLTLSPPIAP
ncbi:hypothetical protein B0H14DRAFT_3479054 [Mycena olivaceomarginata]|nr:hypothetical protein B0H14DRAFT_3479054 [Mycena olivaceomarginata]